MEGRCIVTTSNWPVWSICLMPRHHHPFPSCLSPSQTQWWHWQEVSFFCSLQVFAVHLTYCLILISLTHSPPSHKYSNTHNIVPKTDPSFLWMLVWVYQVVSQKVPAVSQLKLVVFNTYLHSPLSPKSSYEIFRSFSTYAAPMLSLHRPFFEPYSSWEPSLVLSQTPNIQSVYKLYFSFSSLSVHFNSFFAGHS